MEMVKLNNVCDKITDGSHNPPKGVEDGLPMLSSKNITDNGLTLNGARFLSKDDFIQENKRTNINTGDVLITIVGTIGRVVIVDEKHPKFTLQRSVGVLKPNKNLIHPKYLFYSLKSPALQKKLTEGARGVAQQGIYLNSIKNLMIPLPTLIKQKKILDILDVANELFRSDKELVEKYNELVTALFWDMFGDPISNPKRWEVKQLKEIAVKINSGNTPKGGSDVYVKKGITFFRSQNVWRNKLELDDIAYIDTDTHKKMSKSSLNYGDILMTKTGRINTENSSLGRAAMFSGLDDSANINGHVYLIRLHKDIIKEFVLFVLTTDVFREHIRRVCVGGIDKRQLNKEHLEEFPIVYPPIELQKKFVERLKVIEKQKDLATASSLRSEELFHGLLQKAFKSK